MAKILTCNFPTLLLPLLPYRVWQRTGQQRSGNGVQPSVISRRSCRTTIGEKLSDHRHSIRRKILLLPVSRVGGEWKSRSDGDRRETNMFRKETGDEQDDGMGDLSLMLIASAGTLRAG